MEGNKYSYYRIKGKLSKLSYHAYILDTYLEPESHYFEQNLLIVCTPQPYTMSQFTDSTAKGGVPVKSTNFTYDTIR